MTIINNQDLRPLAFSEPESVDRRMVGGGRVKTSGLPWKYTPEQMAHWSDTSVTASYFLLRQMGYSPRQIAAMADWKIQ